MNNGEIEDNDEIIETITLTLNDGTELDCEVLGYFNMEGTDYIALSPEEDEEVLIYRYKKDGDQISLSEIESDEEFESVSEVFDELFCEDDDFDEDEDDDDDDFDENLFDDFDDD